VPSPWASAPLLALLIPVFNLLPACTLARIIDIVNTWSSDSKRRESLPCAQLGMRLAPWASG
jgi:hypothetical protein